eukprot:7855201-Pyramimonas_sp.AAC.1
MHVPRTVGHAGDTEGSFAGGAPARHHLAAHGQRQRRDNGRRKKCRGQRQTQGQTIGNHNSAPYKSESGLRADVCKLAVG